MEVQQVNPFRRKRKKGKVDNDDFPFNSKRRKEDVQPFRGKSSKTRRPTANNEPRPFGRSDFPATRDTRRSDFPGTRDTRRADFPGTRDTRRADFPGTRDTRRADFPGTRDTRRADFPGTRDEKRYSMSASARVGYPRTRDRKRTADTRMSFPIMPARGRTADPVLNSPRKEDTQILTITPVSTPQSRDGARLPTADRSGSRDGRTSNSMYDQKSKKHWRP